MQQRRSVRSGLPPSAPVSRHRNVSRRRTVRRWRRSSGPLPGSARRAPTAMATIIATGRRPRRRSARRRSEEHTSELQSLMRISYAVFCLKNTIFFFFFLLFFSSFFFFFSFLFFFLSFFF